MKTKFLKNVYLFKSNLILNELKEYLIIIC